MPSFVRDVACFRYSIALATPVSVLPGLVLRQRDGLLIRFVSDGGQVGWGEAAPLPGLSRETLRDVESAARDLENLEGHCIDLDAPWRSIVDTGTSWPSSLRFGVEGALIDLAAELRGRSAAALMGARDDAAVPIAFLVSGEGEAARASAERAISEGYRCLKMKAGRDKVSRDADAVRDVASCLPEGCLIRVDANRSWSLPDATAFLAAVADLPIEFLEEPLRSAGDLPALADKATVPLALDETYREPGASESAGLRAASVVVVKPTLAGGIGGAIREATRLRAHGLRVVVSGAYETGVGTRLLAALSAAVSPGTAAGLGTYRYVLDEPLGTGIRGFDSHVSVEDTRRDLSVDTGKMERLSAG